MEPVVLTKEDQEETIEAVVMDNQEEVLVEVAVEAQNTITAVVNTGAEDVEVIEMVITNLIGEEVDITTIVREKKMKSMKMAIKIGEIQDQGVLEATTEVKLVEILEEREDYVELEAVGEMLVVEEDREVLIAGTMIEIMKASTTTIINIHSQLTKKAMMKFNKPKSKWSGSLPRFLITKINSKDWSLLIKSRKNVLRFNITIINSNSGSTNSYHRMINMPVSKSMNGTIQSRNKINT